jgi:hypothetical protein
MSRILLGLAWIAVGVIGLTAHGVLLAQAPSNIVVGEVRWGRTFERNFGSGLTLQVSLVGDENDSQSGIYVSILNKRLPKGHQFVVLPELPGGSESNFIGVFVPNRIDPAELRDELRERLDRGGADLTYFTETFDEMQLEKIEEANLTLNHHGESEATYAAAHQVLDRIKKTMARLRIVRYTLTRDGQPHIDSLRFSFEPSTPSR